jgi:hypothetical protein
MLWLDPSAQQTDSVPEILRATTTNVEVHLHHYVIGFLIAILAEFNHPISLVVLAAGAVPFLQKQLASYMG